MHESVTQSVSQSVSQSVTDEYKALPHPIGPERLNFFKKKVSFLSRELYIYHVKKN